MTAMPGSVGALGRAALRARLRGAGLALRCGPLVWRVRSPLAEVARHLAELYAGYPLAPDGFADHHVAVVPLRGLRRWLRPQVRFLFDGEAPFHPLPRAQAAACLEWGMNWCVGAHGHAWLVLHAAVVAHGAHALVLPGPPGAGKSTLCAALAYSGWRLLSDELALLDPATGAALPLPRPISLKGPSVAVIRERFADARLGPVVPDTRKGDLAFLAAPPASVAAMDAPARVAWIVSPRYEAGTRGVRLERRRRGRMLVWLARNAFNQAVHGEAGFDLLADVVAGAECHALRYGDLDAALAALEALAAGEAAA